MEDNIEVTVLMSVYNTNIEQLRESIESILNQTYKNFEFLIIDDGEKEECINYIKQCNDSRIKLIKNNENIGLAKSLNKGLNLARGKYIVRMDSDDISYPNRIKKQLKFIKENPKYSVVSTRAEIFDENGIYGKTYKYGEIDKKDLIKGTPFIHPTMIINKNILKKIGGYPEYRRCQDYAMIMNMYAHGYKGYIINQVLLKYRMDKNGYKKKKFKYRIMEIKIRFKYFRKMKIDFLSYIYVLKPVLVGCVPKKILEKYHRIKLKK